MKKNKISYILSTLICTFLLFSCSNVIQDLKGKPAPTPDPVSYDPYLTFKGNLEFTLSVNSKNWNGQLDYSTDKENWTEDWDGTAITSIAGSDGKHYVYLRGKNNTHISVDGNETTFVFGGTATEVECNGSIMTLLNYENPPAEIVDDDCFSNLFQNCTVLSKGPALPATKLSDFCYELLFDGCTSLATAPELPATKLADYCYCAAFAGCTSLVTAPALPATKLFEGCYEEMFWECSALKNPPVLNATELAVECYDSMFYRCSALITAPALPATKLKESCYSSMFLECTALENPPVLNATELADDCYSLMFYGCTSLTKSPALPATELFYYCYEEMFRECTSLTEIGKIGNGNALNISVDDAMQYMFYGCSNLKVIETTASDTDRFISFGTLDGSYAVYHMFDGTKDDDDVYTPEENKSYKVAVPTHLTFKGNGPFNLGFDTSEGTGWEGTVEYSTDAKTWVTMTGSDTVASVASKGSHYVYLRGSENGGLYGWSIKLTGAATEVECDGSVMSLLDYYKPNGDTVGSRSLMYLFRGCDKLVKAPELPAVNLNDACYDEMFAGCTFLKATPELPATEIYYVSYARMFKGCTSLNSIGKIAVTNIDAEQSMVNMFSGCKGVKIVETTNTAEAFMTVGTISVSSAVTNMFADCGAGSVTEPIAGKSYKALPFVPSNYLTFEGNDTFTLGVSNDNPKSKKAWDGTVYYSTDKSKWKVWNKDDTSTIASSAVSGGKAHIYLAGNGNSSFATEVSGNIGDYTKLSLTENATDIKCTGNIMTLLDCENPNSATMGKYCFAKLFEGCTKLTKAPSLPATALASCCYEYMFSGCTSLVNAPSLPATTLTDSCYQEMFSGCTALTEAPVLNATTLADYCYYGMFARCSSLAAAPLLPATVLAKECYFGMFKNCTLLESSPELPAEHAEYYCYRSMFEGCTSLTTVGKIHMTDFGGSGNDKEGGIDCMFFDCTSLSVYEIDKDEGNASMSGVFLLPFTDDEYFLSVFENCNKINFSDITSYHYYKYVIE